MRQLPTDENRLVETCKVFKKANFTGKKSTENKFESPAVQNSTYLLGFKLGIRCSKSN